jgi:predicted dehydrogenase
MIGAGAIAQHRHLPGLRAIPGVEIIVVGNRRPESAAAVAARYGIPEVAARWEDVVTRSDIDVVWIGTTPHLHAPITIAALEAGKDVFCQARMAMNLAEARSMLAAAESQPRQVTMLCPPPTAMKHGLYFRELLRDRTIGSLFHFNLRALGAGWVDPSSPAHWRQRIELSGNNILSVGIYAEVLGRFLGDPLSLCAQGRVFIQDRQGYSVRTPDCVQVLGQWPNHVDGVLQWSGVAHCGGDEVLEVYGSEGTLAYNFTSDQVLLARPGQDSLGALPVPVDFVRSWTVEEDFIRAVRGRGYPEPSFRTGVRYMQFVEAVHRSMAAGAWVQIADV